MLVVPGPAIVKEVSNVYPARPTTSGAVIYVGPDAPSDAIDGDIWIN